MFLKFEQEENSVYINADKIVSIYKDGDDMTMITTINPNEFYQVNHSIEEVVNILKCCGIKIY
jgi:uncharacterized protein YlzI (FlbEa/FlbD family)